MTVALSLSLLLIVLGAPIFTYLTLFPRTQREALPYEKSCRGNDRFGCIMFCFSAPNTKFFTAASLRLNLPHLADAHRQECLCHPVFHSFAIPNGRCITAAPAPFRGASEASPNTKFFTAVLTAAEFAALS
jgi:hypothetical protein